MKLRVKGYLIALGVSVLFCGCGSLTDITNTPKAKALGVLGERIQTTQKLDLLKDKPSHTLRLVESSYPKYPRNRRVGVVEAGTTLEVNRVVRVKELFAIFVFLPAYYEWDCALAKIENGPYAGKEIAVQGRSLWEPSVARLGSDYFRTNTVMRPAQGSKK